MFIFDSSPFVYWAIGYTLMALMIGLNWRKSLPGILYVTGTLVVLAMMRLVVVVFNRELNADESQMVSHALTLFQDPVYWRSVDGTTIGPLDNYLLVIPRLLGYQLNYSSARVMGFLCTAGALYFLYVALKRWFSAPVARVALLVPLVFLAFTQEVDFVHYSSEQLPVVLLAMGLAVLAGLSIEKPSYSTDAFLLGFVGGILPFAKLQAVPQALVLVAAGMYLTYHHYRATRQSQPLLLLLLGGITFPALALVWMLSNGVFGDFIDFYILGNAVYADGGGLADIPAQFGKIVLLSPDFTALLLIVVVVMAAGMIAGYRSRQYLRTSQRSRSMYLSVFILAYGLAAVYAVTKSGNLFVHYLNFCIFPLALVVAQGIERIIDHKPVVLLGPVLLLGWFGGQDALSYYKSRQLNAFVSVEARTLPMSPVVKAMQPYIQPGDYLVVWGWQCRYYVEAQLAQGTAENHSERCIFQHPLREVYRERYLNDIQRTRPAVFIDAVGKNSVWLQDSASQGYQTFPELAAYIAGHYKYLGEVDHARLFVRQDRVERSRK